MPDQSSRIFLGINKKLKLTRHTKKLKNTAHNEEKKQSIETDGELMPITELIDKDIKTIIVTIFHVRKLEKDRVC